MAADALQQIGVHMNLDAPVEEMGVANKQLIAISKALRQNARLIIMDEPTSALTEREVRALFEVIHRLRQKGIAFLFVSHKLNEVLEISEQVIVMRNGRKVSEGRGRRIRPEAARAGDDRARDRRTQLTASRRPPTQRP